SRGFGHRFSEQGEGCILNIGWDQSDRGMEGDSGELFATAKNAIMGFTRSLALSLAPSVRVNCIAPGWIRTAWGETASDYWQQRVISETPLQRWGEPQDIANMARFLLSCDAAYITGQVINVNGGAVR
ncbi:MAG: SDR family oxidoreductase, partial [Planctomycetaceae bacterium]|nr:SDR family oxidoreductase [Planctomycetaceae bacterium]